VVDLVALLAVDLLVALAQSFRASLLLRNQMIQAPKSQPKHLERPAKAFGAPESSEDDATDEEESEAGPLSEDDEKESAAGDKKKTKVSRVPVHDGEEGEATLLQFRARLYALESKEIGWKERGFGTLKVNVPKTCVEYDYENNPISGSFDPSGQALEDEPEESTSTAGVVRLIMRQESTHRVILNSVIVKAMKFEEKPTNSAIHILFTAFEETKPVNMLLKMNAMNARHFISEVKSIQHEL